MYTPSSTQSIQARQFQQQAPQVIQQIQQPQAQGSNPIPERLAELLATSFAADIVQKSIQAGRNQVAQSVGGPQPTVADSIRERLQRTAMEAAQQKLAMGSNGHAEMQQKAQGLAAIANQGQNVPQAQGAPQGPQPIQRMAAGGLARLPSNLPSSYAGGGIIAFKTGDEVPDAEWTARRPHETNADYALRMEAGPKYNKVNPESFGADVASLVGRGKDAVLAWMQQRDAALNQARMQPVAEGEAPVANYSNEGREPARVAAPTAPAAAPLPPGLPGADAANKPPRPVATAQAQPNILGAAPVATADEAANSKWTWDRAKELGGINPDTVEKASRDDTTSRMQAAFGPEQAALRAARQQDYEQARAAQTARDTAGAPSIWDRMSTLGKHAGYGQWGQAAGDQRTMELAHEAQKAEGAKGLLALKQASDAMALNDKKEMFGTAETKGAAERKAAQGQQLAGLQSATSLRDTDVRALGTKQAAWDAAQARLQAAKLHYSQLAASGTQMDRAEKQATTQRMVALMQQTQAELGTLTKEGMVKSPEDEARRAALQQQLDALKMQVAASIPGMDKVFASTGAAPGAAPSGAGWSAKIK